MSCMFKSYDQDQLFLLPSSLREWLPGNHVVELSFRKLESMEEAHNDFEIQYVVSNNGRIVFTQTSKKGWPYWGMKQSGLKFISYSVPRELPVNENLLATITIKGDIKAFVEKYGEAQVTIKKGSDL